MTELSTDRRFHSLTQEQVQTLDQVLTEVIPIHGRGNFPTLEVKPKDIIHMVKGKLIEKGIKLRDVRLNGSTASHVLVKENGTSYKDLDIIFGVELPQQEDFQIIKDVVLRCLLDFLPRGVNKDKITVLTMKEAYVQKMVKVFTEHDRWSLISLSNNSGKNVELKFVNSLRRQFEFSVDSFQIILDRMLESYLEAERRQGPQLERRDDRAPEGQRSSKKPEGQAELPSVSPDQDKPQSLDKQPVAGTNVSSSSSGSTCCFDDAEMTEGEPLDTIEEPVAEMADTEKVTETSDMEDITETEDTEKVTEMEHVAEMNALVPGSDLEPQNEANLLEKKKEIEGKDMTEIDNIHSPESSSLKEIVQNVTSTEAAISSNTAAQVHLENSTTHIDSTISHSVPVIQEKPTERQFTLKVKCKSPCQSYACISEESSDTEYTLPPPAKKTYKSQMVVLKYSSPAPPRKMSKKVTNVVSFPVKTNPPDEPSVASQTLNLAKASSVESIPMVVDVTGPETNHCKSRTQTLQNKDCQVKQLSIVDPINTANIIENGTDSREAVTCPQSPSQEFLFPSFEVTSKSNETGIKQVSDKGPYEQIPVVEVEPPSPQALEYLVEMPKSVTPVPVLTTLTSESVAKVSQRVTEVPEFTENLLESSPLVPEFAECILESGPQVLEFIEQSPESAQQVPEFTELELESVPQVAEVTEHNLESAHEVPDFSVQVKEASSPLAELPAHMHDCTTQTSNELQLHTESCESRVSGEPNLLGPDAQVLGSDEQKPVTKVDVVKPVLQEPESQVQLTLSNDQGEVPDAPTLVSVHQVAEPVHQSEKLQMETAPHSHAEEAKIPARDLSGITVVAESMYGDFEQAMDHLRYRLIATRNPEEIRGGGLLKYSNLLVREFKPASETEIKTLERYMCSRFFIDFPDVNEQQRKIESYLRNHFIGEEKSKYDYLMTLRRVVNESTVCLMGHERRQTLNMITVLALKVLGEQNIIPSTTNVTCYYQPAPYMADHSFNNYYIAHGQPPLFYQPYPLHIHMQTGLV